ncbi:MAG: sigma-70 family RNA polymerase sigma factor [Steroidobacteraceae bacterium]
MTSAAAKRRIADWFREWRTPVRRFLLSKSGSMPAADVDDMAQEVFLRLMRYDRAELVEHPQAYLFKVAANVVAEWSIRARHSRPHESKWLDGLVHEDRPELSVLLAQSQEEVERALNTLSPQQQAALRLFFAEGLGHAAIAAELGESLRSVRRHFIKSYEKLRHELDPELLGAITHGRE